MRCETECIRSLLFIFGLIYECNGIVGPKKLYSVDLPTAPVSVKVIGKDLLIVGPWYIGSVTNVHSKFLQPRKMIPKILSVNLPNPRNIGSVPSNSTSKHYWVATWGTNDTSGAMNILRLDGTYLTLRNISTEVGWNYERSLWTDMNLDGRLDCLTARFKNGVGQLLFIHRPYHRAKWRETLIHEGIADRNFIRFAKGDREYLLVAGLQSHTLALYWTITRSSPWSESSLVRHRILDNYGKYYDVQYIDLNRDGTPDVLTNTVNLPNSRGYVLGYEVPNDIENKIWKRRILAGGFLGDFSPGKASAFWPNKWKRETDRPSIFLSGAGEELLFILTPRPANSGWSYVKSSLRAGTGVVGLPFIGDIDGDSTPEVFVPQANKLHVYSFDYNVSIAGSADNPYLTVKATPRPVFGFLYPFSRPQISPAKNDTQLREGKSTTDAATITRPTGQAEPSHTTFRVILFSVISVMASIILLSFLYNT